MSTVEELQQQLEELQRRHQEEIQKEVGEFEKINQELNEIQELTERLEEEEHELDRRFGARHSNKKEGNNNNNSNNKNNNSVVLPFIEKIVLGLVDADDARSYGVPPSIIPPHARGGEVYRAAVENDQKSREDVLYRYHNNNNNNNNNNDNNIFYNQNKYKNSKYKNNNKIPSTSLGTNYFKQQIDHADPSVGTFLQRWWVETSFWNKTSGPAILYINGEGPATSFPGGFIFEFAVEVGAAVFSLEHRYYGGSLPAPLINKSMLRYLTVENALADLQAFQQYAEREVLGPEYNNNNNNDNNNNKTKWLLVGGSYAGALSAWARETYPQQFNAAWSSSGVVNAIFDYYQFDGHLLEVLPPSCANSIRYIFEAFSDAYDDLTQRERVLQTLGTPKYFTKADISWMLADASAMAVQYGSKNQLCSALQPVNKTDPIQQYADFIKQLWGPSFTSECYYSTECLSNISYSNQWSSNYAWVYQCCSQLAYWQTSYPGSLRLSEITTSYFINQCRAAFGENIFPDTFAFNKRYGGATPNATNVVATQGSDDPWLPAGVIKTINKYYPEITAECDGCGHCGDMGGSSSSDPPSLVEQRKKLASYLKSWLLN